MQKAKEWRSIRLWQTTLDTLGKIQAKLRLLDQRESIVSIVDRLAKEEIARLGKPARVTEDKRPTEAKRPVVNQGMTPSGKALMDVLDQYKVPALPRVVEVEEDEDS